MQKLKSTTMPWPTDWPALFGREAPLILEIGFGYGQFLVHLAQTHPEANIIGLEISNRCLALTEETLVKKGLQNVRVIHSTAEMALHYLFTPESLSEVHINFPDPWFKSRHQGRRLMQRDTLDALVNRMQHGALLYLSTDIRDYAEMSDEILRETPQLDNQVDGPWADSMPGRVITKYERKAGVEGRPCYYFAYRRNAQPALPLPQMEELPMPHIVFHSPLTLAEMRAAYEAQVHQVGEHYISLMGVYEGTQSLLFEVYVREPNIDQRFALLIVHRENPDEYTIKLSSLGQPRPTQGVHQATGLLGKWVLSLHPESRIVKQKIRQ